MCAFPASFARLQRLSDVVIPEILGNVSVQFPVVSEAKLHTVSIITLQMWQEKTDTIEM